MGKMKVEKPSEQALKKLGVSSWPIWEKEVSKFPWHYGETETCYILEGKLRVKSKTGETIEAGKGDLVTFPEGMDCTWEVLAPVRKHYKFG
jgi:uncharacterized protein